MYIAIENAIEFEWDAGNIHKSYKKHGISPNETEEIFVDRHVIKYEDRKHSVKEKRSLAIGNTKRGQCLFVVFTMRKEKIRIISARPAANKERRLYEKIKKNTAF